MDVALLADNHKWPVLVLSWRTLRGPNEELVSPLGAGLDAHTTPFTLARQGQVQGQCLAPLHHFPLLALKVLDDIIRRKCFLYYQCLLSPLFVFALSSLLPLRWRLPETSLEAILW